MTAAEAKEFGIIDEVVFKKPTDTSQITTSVGASDMAPPSV